MSSTQFTVDMEDIQFVLFDQLNIHQTLRSISAFADFDEDLYKAMLEEAERISVEVYHPINGPGDRGGCQLDDHGNVTTPAGYQEAWRTIADGGWIAPSAPAEVGGAGLPSIISMVVNEMFSGACMAMQMYPGLTAAAARVLRGFGPQPVATAYAEKMFSGQWAGTMCLTEANAGSSVGDNRCKAIPTTEDGVYLLEGEKIFISGADQDLTENIVHLVLAKTPGAPEGTKGLSLFMCPKFLIHDDMSLGERNDAFVVGIEEKMGIHGSATCTLALGANGPCKAWLVGSEFEGIQLMFHMMNEARIGVGIQGMAVGAAAYNYSVSYARERVQGTSLKNLRDASAPRVPIIEHPDVRRMLMTQKVLVEGMRSFIYRVGYRHMLAEHTADPDEAEKHLQLVELLVPVAKAFCTDRGFDVAVLAVQIFGGYGFIGEYPVEQLVRDGKIMSIYEGTNGIQAMDLLGRKMRQKGGALFMQWMHEAQEYVAAATAAGFATEAENVGKAVQHVGVSAMHLGGLGAQGQLDAAMVHATPFLEMMGWVQLSIELLDQAVVAKRVMNARGETPFLKGKLDNMRFYVATQLPKAIALGKAIQSSDQSCMEDYLF